MPRRARNRHVRTAAAALAALCGAVAACAGPASQAPPRTSPSASSPAVATTGPSWTTGGVCYEVFIRSFYDSNGDGIGDINGLIDKLDYINDGNPASTRDLGADCIWLMPVTASPSYHGYDVSDYYRVQPAYGTNADFKRLVAEAHRRGIARGTDSPLCRSARDPGAKRRGIVRRCETSTTTACSPARCPISITTRRRFARRPSTSRTSGCARWAWMGSDWMPCRTSSRTGGVSWDAPERTRSCASTRHTCAR